ncbi:MAG: sodium:proton antiporter [Gammaproteobacteria bacterium]
MHTQALLPVLILAVGIAAQWLAWRTRLPAIVLLAAAGLLIGPVMNLVPSGPEISATIQPIVSLCVAIILFEGGLSLQRTELRVAAVGVGRLVYVGGPLAWLLGTLAAHYIGGLSWYVATVFGAIMVVTGPTVIMPLLRQSSLNRRTASYLKWEGIVNDPIGALMAVLSFQFFVFAGEGEGGIVQGLLAAIGAALLLGALFGWLIGKAFQRGMVPEYLKSPVLLTLVLLVYLLSNRLQAEAGLLAVTVMGIVVGNMNLPGLQDMKRFKEYITVMLVSVVFVLLTATLDPAVIQSVDVRGVLLVGAILFLVRPLAVMLATLGAGMDIRDRVLLAWIAPRGIVAAATAGVMGPAMAQRGFEGAESLLPLVFGVIFATVLAHGLSIGWLARRLGLSSSIRDSVLIVGSSPWTVELARTLQSLEKKVLVADSSWHKLRAARLAGLPVFYGEILSDFADESVELGHVRMVLAATDNDAYNALVCTAMAPEIGHDRVFQLAMGDAAEDDPRGVAEGLRGQIAFGESAEYENLWRHHVDGWVFSRTRLTDSYTYSEFLGDADSRALQILLVKDDGRSLFLSPQQELEPGPGDVLVSYGPPRQAESTVPAASPPLEDDAAEISP